MGTIGSHDAFRERGQSLEEGYFRSRDSQLVDKLRKVFETKVARDELKKAAGISSDEVLDRMMQLNISGQMLTAFKLFPLVEIAWADGSVDAKEVEAVINGAVKHGIPRDSEVMSRLRDWLSRGPTADGRAVWKMYAAELRKSLSPDQLKTFREDLLNQAHAVAQAGGGIFNIFLTESQSEKKVIEEIRAALTN
ncbi:MAG: TerB family tellurite resistance protein [Planctomycetes bacterium]|nr:TerB family tellurite resistance protein [Planctomycetota bacterium]